MGPQQKNVEHPSGELLDTTHCGVVVTDIQTSFLSLLPEDRSWIQRLCSLVQVPKKLDVPVLITEQTPEKLGSTVDPIRQALPEAEIIPKSTYNSLENEHVMEWIEGHDLQQIVFTGIMTNVCILQTTIHACRTGYQVHIPSDGCAASSEEDHWWALRRMERAGAVVTTLETVAHEWLKSPDHPAFSDLLPVLKELSS
jgi:nicotinamidase-related amidase